MPGGTVGFSMTPSSHSQSGSSLDKPPCKDWDHILVELLDFLYHHKFPIHGSSMVISAASSREASLRRPLETAVPAVSPFIVVCRLILVMFRNSATGTCSVVLLLVETYFWVSKPLSLSPSQITATGPLAVGAASHACILIRTADQQTPMKTGLFDHSVPLDLNRQTALVRNTLRLASARQSSQRPFHITYVACIMEFHAVLI